MASRTLTDPSPTDSSRDARQIPADSSLAQLLQELSQERNVDLARARRIMREQLQSLIARQGGRILNGVSTQAARLLAQLTGAPPPHGSGATHDPSTINVPIMSLVATLATQMPELRGALERFNVTANFSMRGLDSGGFVVIDPRMSIRVQSELGPGTSADAAITRCDRTLDRGARDFTCSYNTSFEVKVRHALPIGTPYTPWTVGAEARHERRTSTTDPELARGRSNLSVRVGLTIPLGGE